MQTRRDQFQAYKYLVRRVLASMIGNDPEAPEQPMRRVGGASAMGILFGALACGGVAVYGWIVGTTSDSWTEQSDIVVREKSTNALFFYGAVDSPDKELHPIPNLTTAKLYLGTAELTQQDLSKGSLGLADPGPGFGIPDAPAVLPDIEDLTQTPWAACSRPSRGSDSTDLGYQTDVVVGDKDIEQQEVDEELVLVKPESSDAGDADLYVLYNGKRLAIEKSALTALDLDQQPPITVSPTLLNAIPAGDDFVGPVPEEVGSGPTVDGQATAIGQVLQDDTQGSYWLVVERNGVRTITDVQAQLLLSLDGGGVLPGGAEQTEATEAPIIQLQELDTGEPTETGDLPTQDSVRLAEPKTNADEATVCAWYEGGEEAPTISLNGDVPNASGASESAAENATGALKADHTIVESGRGAVVGLLPAQGSTPKVYYVVLSDGKAYQVPADSLTALGYADSEEEEFSPPSLPSRLLKLIPEGPALTQEAALQPWGN